MPSAKINKEAQVKKELKENHKDHSQNVVNCHLTLQLIKLTQKPKEEC